MGVLLPPSGGCKQCVIASEYRQHRGAPASPAKSGRAAGPPQCAKASELGPRGENSAKGGREEFFLLFFAFYSPTMDLDLGPLLVECFPGQGAITEFEVHSWH